VASAAAEVRTNEVNTVQSIYRVADRVEVVRRATGLTSHSICVEVQNVLENGQSNGNTLFILYDPVGWRQVRCFVLDTLNDGVRPASQAVYDVNSQRYNVGMSGVPVNDGAYAWRLATINDRPHAPQRVHVFPVYSVLAANENDDSQDLVVYHAIGDRGVLVDGIRPRSSAWLDYNRFAGNPNDYLRLVFRTRNPDIFGIANDGDIPRG